VQTDLEAEGYEVFPYVLPACAINAPHRRDRVWFVAYRNCNGLNRSNGKYEVNASKGREYALGNIEQNDFKYTKIIGYETALENGELERGRFGQSNKRNFWDSFPSQSPICGGDDGISTKLDGITFSKWRNESIKAFGNAIVPQVAYQIFKAIEEYGKQRNGL
jgi:DNA (cytosine-5)-methyltransferase 1